MKRKRYGPYARSPRNYMGLNTLKALCIGKVTMTPYLLFVPFDYLFLPLCILRKEKEDTEGKEKNNPTFPLSNLKRMRCIPQTWSMHAVVTEGKPFHWICVVCTSMRRGPSYLLWFGMPAEGRFHGIALGANKWEFGRWVRPRDPVHPSGNNSQE